MGGFSKTWCHMRDMYPQQIEKTGATEVWRTAPVAFESCWDMRKWEEEGWDIRHIFDYALNYHVSYLNNKSARIPEGTYHEIERFLRKIGYRLVLRQMEHRKVTSCGSLFPVFMIWDNVGVAPPYRDYLLALRFSHSSSKEKLVLIGETSIKDWLPGEIEVTESFQLPGTLKTGRYQIAVAVIDPGTGEPIIRLAITGRAEDGWYPLSEVDVI
jgi:hypothetical protein